MLFVNRPSHLLFLTIELNKLLAEGSFASRLQRAIGRELHHRLVGGPDESETGIAKLFPVDALFVWATSHGGLDPEWLANEDGSYLDDNGEVIPPSVNPTYSATEQLAAYGLWLLDEMIAVEILGPMPGEGTSDHGWSREEVIEHGAACMLLSYQALSYSQRILSGTQLTADEAARAEQFNFSAMGKGLAKKRHAETYDMADMVRDYWKSNIDPVLSAQKAADEVIKANLVNLSHKKIAAVISALRTEEGLRKK